jgi:hypothetical protein
MEGLFPRERVADGRVRELQGFVISKALIRPSGTFSRGRRFSIDVILLVAGSIYSV